MTAGKSEPMFLIDGPSPFAPLSELLAWRDECRAMLAKHPDHSQWLDALVSVEQAIANHRKTT
jgi:hypothetical protein